MSRAKANWLRAFNKVRMQLQEVSGGQSTPTPVYSHHGARPLWDTPTTGHAHHMTRPPRPARQPRHQQDHIQHPSLLNNIILIILPKKPMVTTYPQPAGHAHHIPKDHTHPQTQLYSPFADLLQLSWPYSDALALWKLGLVIRIGGLRLEKPCKD